jgi:hypothetical protein
MRKSVSYFDGEDANWFPAPSIPGGGYETGLRRRYPAQGSSPKLMRIRIFSSLGQPLAAGGW